MWRAQRTLLSAGNASELQDSPEQRLEQARAVAPSLSQRHRSRV